MSNKDELIGILEKILKKARGMKHTAVGDYTVYTNDENNYLSVSSPLRVEYTLHRDHDLYIQTKFANDMHEFYKFDTLIADMNKLLSIMPEHSYKAEKETIQSRIEGLKADLVAIEELEKSEE